MTEEIPGFAVAFSITFSLSSSYVCSGFCLFFCQNVILMAKTFSRRFQVVILILSITLKLQQSHCSSSCCLFLLHIKKWIVSLLMKFRKSGIFFSLNISITAVVLLYCLFFVLGSKEYCKDLSEKRFEFVELLSQ